MLCALFGRWTILEFLNTPSFDGMILCFFL
jgi:hypothetical protein